LLGHFSEFIELPIPTLQSRLQILEGFAGLMAADEILRKVAARTHAFTAADLKRLCYKACMAAVSSSEPVMNGKLSTSQAVCHWMQSPRRR
jgi:ATP-dependent 26S proteasome regulatory subunit